MTTSAPRKVLIVGGKQAGGVASFAEGLRSGFAELGIPVEVAPSRTVVRRLGELRDPHVLKILSLSALFAAPLARRALCVAHGFPCAALQGWPATLAILLSLKLANSSRGTMLTAVSDYSALHLQSIFNLRVDAVIRNPVQSLFLQAAPQFESKRQAIIFVGRLHKAKNVDKLLPAIGDVLNENPDLCAWVVGDGPMRPELKRMAAGNDRIEFLGALPPQQVCDRMRHSRVFISANPAEPFGIVYLEALSQCCAVAMPASGGGLEIVPELIGKSIHLFPASISREGVASALREALNAAPTPIPLAAYSPRAVAKAYLAADARFDSKGICLVRGAR